MEKKFDLKKFLSNNAIIILIILLALFVGCTTQNFFTETNGKNLLLNVAPRFIIACGVSGCLITKGTDLSAGRQVGLACQVGLAACFSAMLPRQRGRRPACRRLLLCRLNPSAEADARIDPPLLLWADASIRPSKRRCGKRLPPSLCGF